MKQISTTKKPQRKRPARNSWLKARVASHIERTFVERASERGMSASEALRQAANDWMSKK